MGNKTIVSLESGEENISGGLCSGLRRKNAVLNHLLMKHLPRGGEFNSFYHEMKDWI
jgi:hypothetical protein